MVSRLTKAGLIAVAAVVLTGSAAAIDFDRVAPKQPQAKGDAGAAELQQPPAPEQAKGGQAPATAPRLKAIVVVKSRAEVQPGASPDVTGIRVGPGEELDVLRGDDFEYLMEAYLGAPVTEAAISNVQREIVLYYRSIGRPLVDVILPEQTSVGDGVLQIFVLEGRLGRVVVEGNKWTDTDRILKEISLEEGQPVNTRELMKDVNWLNTNPGRRIEPALRPGEQLGASDVVLRVNEKSIPWRFFLGVENSGPQFTGENRMFAGFNWFDAFGWDHRLNYQFTADVTLESLVSHSASYEIPLPWRHTLTFFGGYIVAESDFPAGGVVLEGESWQSSMRYNVPLPGCKYYEHSIDLGFDYKTFDNNLESGGTTVFPTDVDIAQFVAQYNVSMNDNWGGTRITAGGFYSPGDLVGSNNDDASFAPARGLSEANYYYGRFGLRRETRLPANCSWVVRGSAQLADGNLQASEQLGLGGAMTVRGYHEREANGDQGWIVANELHLPPFSMLKFLDPDARDRMVLLGFFDYGQVEPKDVALAGEDPHVIMSSVGAGLRYNIRDNFSVRFDYGWQLRDSGVIVPRDEQSRGHVSAVLSF